MPDRKLDIIIPVYNEGKNISRVLDALAREVQTPFCVLICYDFDEDDTLDVVARYPQKKVDIVTAKNHGNGVHDAIITGFEVTTAPAVLVLPADDDYNAGRIDHMTALLLEGCDIVCSSRFLPGGKMAGCPWLKAVLVRTASFILFLFARLPCHDATNGFRLFSRRVVDTIEIESSIGFTYSIELLVKSHRMGWRIEEVPVHWYERGRDQGQSRFRVLKWLPGYLRWFFYVFATTWLCRGLETVPFKTQAEGRQKEIS